jgi:methanogenic corrinoid protein MtbC1
MVGTFRSFDSGKSAITAASGHAVPPPAGGRSWTDLLGDTIESEVLPRLLSAQRAACCPGDMAAMSLPNPADIEAFLELIVADDLEQARAVADRVIVQSGGRDALLHCLLTPAAQRLGEMWERDLCDFTTVTLGVFRLDQIMKETATVGHEYGVPARYDHRVLLVPAPGEQHGFGLGMVADVFREGGWCVRSGPAVSRSQLLRLVRDEWFDVVGLSVTADRSLKGLAACIRAVRLASRNRRAFLMVGGHAVASHAERTRFLGADAAPRDAASALAEATIFVETTMTDTLRQSGKRLVDIG